MYLLSILRIRVRLVSTRDLEIDVAKKQNIIEPTYYDPVVF